MGSKKKKKGSCSRWLLPGEGEHKLHRCSEALPACRSFSASVRGHRFVARETFMLAENKTLVQLVDVRPLEIRGDIQS